MGRKRGMPGIGGGDSSPPPFSSGHKQVGAEKLPSRHAIAKLTGGDHFQRSMSNYAKQAPLLEPPILTRAGN